MHMNLVQISKARGIHLTLALWTILSPKLGGNESRKHLSQEDVNKPDEQAYVVDTDKKVECLSSSK